MPTRPSQSDLEDAIQHADALEFKRSELNESPELKRSSTVCTLNQLTKLIENRVHVILSESKDLIVYHGTNSARARSILRHGFDLTREGEKLGLPRGGVSFSRDEEIAAEHAELAASKFGGQPAVLKFNLGKSKIMPGSEFDELCASLGGHDRAVLMAKKNGYDGADLCDFETGNGCEELEVVVWNTSKLKPTS